MQLIRVLVVTMTMCALGAVRADAQFSSEDPATGERYVVELAYGLWSPDPGVVFSSESLGIPGTTVDLVADLGISKAWHSEFRAVLRPGRKHKFRIGYIPIQYQVEGAILSRPIVFNGIQYTVGLPVNSLTQWNTWRFGYEYDFVYRDRGFVGLVLEAKYTDARIELQSPIADEFASARAPIPALGLIGRGYVARNVAVTGEFTFFRLPNGEEDEYKGNYYDFDLYGTLNFTNNVGFIAGYRSLDVGYTIDLDFGELSLDGFYLMGVVRF
jgi:hypothetical protein